MISFSMLRDYDAIILRLLKAFARMASSHQQLIQAMAVFGAGGAAIDTASAPPDRTASLQPLLAASPF